MKNKILATALVLGTLTTASFAYNGNCQYNDGQRGVKQGQEMNNQQGKMQRGMKQGHKMSKRGIGRDSEMRMFYTLNLTNEQKFQISVLRDEMRLEMKKQRGPRNKGRMVEFISDSGFDKSAFIKNSNERHAKMTELKAAQMEKVFKILTKEQLAELKKNLAK